MSDGHFAALWPQLRPPGKKESPVGEGEERKRIPRWKLAGSRCGPELLRVLLAPVNHGTIEPTCACGGR